MKIGSRIWLSIPALAILPACQQMPTTLPYAVTDDCRVERRASLPALGDGFGVSISGVRDAPTRLAASSASGPTSDGPRIPRAETSEGRRPPRSESEDRPTRGPRRSGGGFGFAFSLPAAMPLPPPDLADELTRSGPQFPASFSMSCAPVQAFVRSGWPVVIDYRPDGASAVVLEIHAAGRDQPYVVPLPRDPRRQLAVANVPQSFGEAPQVALFLVRAVRDESNAPGGMQLFGLGAGPRAVGSVAIERVDFQPASMLVSQKQKALYSFYSRSDFNRTVVEILRVERRADEIKVSLARSVPLEGAVNRGTWVGKKENLTWDGYDRNNHVSSGPHLLQVRAWLNAQNERDWVAAWSQNTVVVAE